jgi:hypothetical protein
MLGFIFIYQKIRYDAESGSTNAKKSNSKFFHLQDTEFPQIGRIKVVKRRRARISPIEKTWIFFGRNDQILPNRRHSGRFRGPQAPIRPGLWRAKHSGASVPAGPDNEGSTVRTANDLGGNSDDLGNASNLRSVRRYGNHQLFLGQSLGLFAEGDDGRRFARFVVGLVLGKRTGSFVGFGVSKCRPPGIVTRRL